MPAAASRSKPARRPLATARRNLVSVGNDFARATLEVDSLQMRLLLMLALRDQQGGVPRTHRMTMTDCRRLLNLPDSGKSYLSVRELAENIASAAMWRPVSQIPEGFLETDPLIRSLVSPDSRKYFHRLQIFDRVYLGIDEGNSENDAFIVRFNEEFTPYILQLRERFAQVDIEVMFNLGSGHARRFYMYCCSWHPDRNPGANWQMTIAEFRNWLELPATMTVKNMRSAVIEYAQQKLDESADLSFDFMALRSGRNVTGWRFTPRRTRRKSKRVEAIAAPTMTKETSAEYDAEAAKRAQARAWWEAASEDDRNAFFKAVPDALIFRGANVSSMLLARIATYLETSGLDAPTDAVAVA